MHLRAAWTWSSAGCVCFRAGELGCLGLEKVQSREGAREEGCQPGQGQQRGWIQPFLPLPILHWHLAGALGRDWGCSRG